MYTLTRGPSKLATQRRTGPTQQAVESSKLGEYRGRAQPGLWPPASPAQKLVFNRVNGKRPPLLLQQISAPEECYTLAHEENVRFVYEGEGRGSLGQQPGELEQMEPLPAPTPCWGHRWQARSPQPGHSPSFAPPPAPVPLPPCWEPVPNPPSLVPSPAWQQVEQQLDSSRSGESACGPVQYVEKTPNPGLKNFVPIDLEDWWAQQFLAKIENSS
uniref:Uncharacterized protein n=1 Tax=Geospiza parvula TaxID=87175 RepID=A0A8C3N1V1_GEOPR